MSSFKEDNYFWEKEEDALLGRFFNVVSKPAWNTVSENWNTGIMLYNSANIGLSKWKKNFTYQYPNIVQM